MLVSHHIFKACEFSKYIKQKNPEIHQAGRHVNDMAIIS